MTPPTNDLDVWQQAILVLDKVVPYAAPLVHRLVAVPVRGFGDAICVDTHLRVFFDPAYAARIGLSTFTADVLHESLHPLSQHFERAREMGLSTPEELRAWNVAADKALNGSVFAIAAAHPKAVTPGGQTFRSEADQQAIKASKWLHPFLFNQDDGLLAEEYYDLDQQAAQQQQQQQSGQNGQQGQSGQQQQQQGGASQQQSGKAGQRQQSGQSGQPQNGAGQPGQSGAGKGSCGSVATGDDGDAQTARAHAMAMEQHGQLPDGPSAEEQQSLRVEVAEATAAHERQHGRGSVPGGILRAVEALRRPPVVDWRKRLATLIRSGLSAVRGASDYAMTRPKWRDGIGLPRLMAPNGRVAVIADTSGSMGDDDLRRVLDETGGVLRAGSVERLWWIPTDSRAPQPVIIRDLRQARLVGGGGTEMGAGLRAASLIRPNVHLSIVITDGDTEWPRTKPAGCGRVLIVRTRPSRHALPAWADGVCDAFRR